MLEYGPLPLPGGYQVLTWTFSSFLQYLHIFITFHQRREKKPKVYAAYGGKRDDSPPPPPPPPAPRKTSRRVNEGSLLSRRRSQKEAGGSSNPSGGTSLWSSGSLKRPTKPVRTTVASRARSLSPRTATRESVSMRSYTSTIRKDSFSAKRI